VSEECIFDELGVDERHLKVHDPAYLLDVVLFLLLTDVPRLLPIVALLHVVLAVLQRIRIVKGLLSKLEIEHVPGDKSFDNLRLTQMGIWVFIHN
jgi:hypothetical protein